MLTSGVPRQILIESNGLEEHQVKVFHLGDIQGAHVPIERLAIGEHNICLDQTGSIPLIQIHIEVVAAREHANRVGDLFHIPIIDGRIGENSVSVEHAFHIHHVGGVPTSQPHQRIVLGAIKHVGHGSGATCIPGGQAQARYNSRETKHVGKVLNVRNVPPRDIRKAWTDWILQKDSTQSFQGSQAPAIDGPPDAYDEVTQSLIALERRVPKGNQIPRVIGLAVWLGAQHLRQNYVDRINTLGLS